MIKGCALPPGCRGAEGEGRAHVRALRRLMEEAPFEAERAAVSLALFLKGITASPWQKVAWSFSRLTGDGFPVEFAFSSADEAIRYTTEVAGPEVEEERRLDHALEHLAGLAGLRLSEETDTLFHRIQASRHLRYGAWAGGRHGAGTDRYKLYVEVPPEGEKEARLFLDTLMEGVPFQSICETRLVMIGCEPGSSRIEFYFRANRPEPWEVSLLMRRVGLTSRVEEFFNLIEDASETSLHRLLSAPPLGFSIAVTHHGEPGAFSLFMTGGSLFGSDRAIRRRVLELGLQKGWGLKNYALISQPLARRTGWNTWHGLFSFVAVFDGPPILQIGLRPPEMSQGTPE